MKKVLKSPKAPDKLRVYFEQNPDSDWAQFTDKKGRYGAVADQLKKDQRGLCAYCEINLLERNEPSNLDDFHVEHFHPKSPHAPPPNWALDWNNLLGVCYGGVQSNVVDPTRFTADKAQRCCDAPKGDHDWTGKILNPLTDIPAFPRLFDYTESGGISPDPINCPANLKKQAQDSIDLLNLDAKRLRDMRMEVIAALNETIGGFLAAGHLPAEAAHLVAQAQFASGLSPTFFTCVRWYLGVAAENQLSNLGYCG